MMIYSLVLWPDFLSRSRSFNLPFTLDFLALLPSYLIRDLKRSTSTCNGSYSFHPKNLMDSSCESSKWQEMRCYKSMDLKFSLFNVEVTGALFSILMFQAAKQSLVLDLEIWAWVHNLQNWESAQVQLLSGYSPKVW